MAIRRVAGAHGEIVTKGAAGRVAVRLAAWHIVDGMLEGRVTFADPFHSLSPEGVFRAPWGRHVREWAVRGDLASGAVEIVK